MHSYRDSLEKSEQLQATTAQSAANSGGKTYQDPNLRTQRNGRKTGPGCLEDIRLSLTNKVLVSLVLKTVSLLILSYGLDAAKLSRSK